MSISIYMTLTKTSRKTIKDVVGNDDAIRACSIYTKMMHT